MGSMLGGGQQTGGTVVGGPTPEAANLAGQYGVQAARAASDAAISQTQTGIDMVRQQYNNAFSDLQPYTQTGIQALDQLNQYMGLNAYDPGNSPLAPKVNMNDVNSYINQNMYMTPGGQGSVKGKGFGNTYYGYGGVGSVDGGGNISNSSSSDTDYYGQVTGTTSGDIYGTNPGMIRNNSGVRNAVTDYLQGQLNDPTNPAQVDYQNQLQQYNYAKKLQTQYDAQGPLTPQQVADKLASQPGYQFQLQQGQQAIQGQAAAQGMVGGGRVLQSLVNYGSGLAQQTYGDTLNRLAALAGAGQAAATSQATGAQNLGAQLLGAHVQLGDTLANSALSQGNSLAQATLAANQQYKVIGQQSSGGGGGIGSLLGGAASLLGSSATGGSGLMGLFG